MAPQKFTMKSQSNFGPHGHQENHQSVQRGFSFSHRKLAILKPVSLTCLYKYLPDFSFKVSKSCQEQHENLCLFLKFMVYSLSLIPMML